jgi:hypothetical protein
MRNLLHGLLLSLLPLYSFVAWVAVFNSYGNQTVRQEHFVAVVPFVEESNLYVFQIVNLLLLVCSLYFLIKAFRNGNSFVKKAVSGVYVAMVCAIGFYTTLSLL